LVLLLTHVVLGTREVMLARQHHDVVPELSAQRQAMRFGVDFATALCGRREAMNDDEDSHHTPCLRRMRQPRAAETPPTYWPSGQGRARGRARGPGSRRVCKARQDVTDRSRAGTEGIVRSWKSANSSRCKVPVRQNSYRADR